MKNGKITYLMTWVVYFQFIGGKFDAEDGAAASEAKRLVFDVILFVLVSS